MCNEFVLVLLMMNFEYESSSNHSLQIKMQSGQKIKQAEYRKLLDIFLTNETKLQQMDYKVHSLVKSYNNIDHMFPNY